MTHTAPHRPALALRSGITALLLGGLLATAGLLPGCGGGGGSGGAGSRATTLAPGVAGVAFSGSVLLGSPTADSIRISLLAADQSGQIVVAYGTATGVYPTRMPAVGLTAGQPLALTLSGLAADTAYVYRLEFQGNGSTEAVASPEYRFHTARPAGSTFTFTIQADSHLDENSDLDQYRLTLANVAADAPDFHIDLGDTFMTEKHAAPLTATAQMAPDAATVDARYAYERGHFGLLTHSSPLFLVNGNHDAELGWLTDGTDQNVAIWATKARQRFFLNPVPGGFYSGDSFSAPFVGERAACYSWTWGDALFVVLEPSWNSANQASRDAWNITLGAAQYRWLAATLSASKARHKFVFVHNLVGGLDGQMRGGVEAAPYFEWGGRNADGSDGFAAHRPGWDKPIHTLLMQHGVTAVFHGHDHLYAHQTLDGIAYQEVPQPSALNFSNGATLARDYHYAAGTVLSSSGHLRVTVSPQEVKVEYIRSWLPKNETALRRNAQVDDTWTLAPSPR